MFPIIRLVPTMVVRVDCYRAQPIVFASMSHPQGSIEQLVWRSGLSLSLFFISSLKKKFGRSETNLCFLIDSLACMVPVQVTFRHWPLGRKSPHIGH
jgi:hypothetical protein